MSRREVPATPAKLGGNARCAHGNERAARELAICRRGREPVDAHGHAWREVEAEIKFGEHAPEEDYPRRACANVKNARHS
jgi:hypothetical protein